MDELIARFTLENPEEIKTVFSVNFTPSKVSQLENDLDFVRREEVNLPDVDFDEFATKQEVENISTQKVDISNFENTIDDINSALETKQPKGDYASPNDIPDVSNLATKEELNSKQDTLTAGENITIENGVISSTGGRVDLTGYIKNKEAMTESIVIGNTSTASNAIVIGLNQRATGRYSIAMGEDCSLSNTNGISVGRSNYLNGTSNIAIGNSLTTSGSNSIAIGQGSYPNTSAGGGNSIAIGTSAQATGSASIALGSAAKATQNNAIQLGIGTNNTVDTFQVWDYQLLNKADGKMPIERLPFQTITQADYDALETKDANTLYLIEE